MAQWAFDRRSSEERRGWIATAALIIAPRHFFPALRRAALSMRRRPGFLAIAVSSLAVALGLATTVIAELDALTHPDEGTPIAPRIHVLEYGGRRGAQAADDDVQLVVQSSGVFDAYAFIKRGAAVTLEIGARSYSNSSVGLVQNNALDVIEGRPVRGRWFAPGETTGSNVALIPESTWRRELGSPDSLDAVRLRIGGVPYRVVGVIPKALAVLTFGVILPLDLTSAVDNAAETRLVARARPGISSDDASAAVKLAVLRWNNAHGTRATMVLSARNPFYQFRLRLDTIHKGMLIGVTFIVLIACANVSALMLARSVARRRDQALRLALGGERIDLMRDVTAEVAIIALAGAAAGLIVGYWSMKVFIAITPPELSWMSMQAPHWSLAVFAKLFAVVVVVVIAASLLPSMFVSRIAPIEQLKADSGTTTARQPKSFQLLVVGELALALVLMVSALLVSRTAETIGDFDFGYEAREISQVTPAIRVMDHPVEVEERFIRNRGGLQRAGYVPQVARNAPDDIVNKLRLSHGIRDAAWVAYETDETRIVVSDATYAIGGQLLNPQAYNVGPGFLRTLGIPILHGRDFTEGDRAGIGAVILDERSARHLFPDGDAVGRLVKLERGSSAEPWVRVVGVARNAIHRLPEDPQMDPYPVVYVSRTPRNGFQPQFVVRAERNARNITAVAAAMVGDLLPPRTAYQSQKWIAYYDYALKTKQFAGQVFVTLSLASIVLAAAGLIGVLTYTVNQRMREFAVRVALGATRQTLVQLVVRDGVTMTLGGTALGGVAAMYAAFTVEDWLWGVYPVNAPALVTAEAILFAITMVGLIVPAIRAARANPVDVMRAI